MKHKLIKISLVVYLVYIIIVILFFYLYDFPCKVLLLGNGYYIDYDPNSDLALFAPPSKPCADIQGPITIQGPIIKYKFNNRYIIVKEKPREKINNKFKLDTINFSDIYDIEFNKIKYFNFWIIDKHSDNMYGPYEKYDFRLKFKELNLPDSLMIK